MAERVGVRWTRRLLNTKYIHEREVKTQQKWRTGLVVPVWKRKKDVQDPGKYRGIAWLNHIVKVLEKQWSVKWEKNNKVSKEEEVRRTECSL